MEVKTKMETKIPARSSIGSTIKSVQNDFGKMQMEWASQMDEHVGEVEKTLRSRREKLISMSKDLESREKKLEEGMKKLQKREEAFDIYCKEEEAFLADLREKVERKLSYDKELEKKLGEKDEEIRVLKKKLASESELKKKMEEKDAEISDMKEKLTSATWEIDLLKRQNGALKSVVNDKWRIELEERENLLSKNEYRISENEKELEWREKILRRDREKLQERERDMEARELEYDENAAKLRSMERRMLKREMEVEFKFKECGDGAQVQPPVWQAWEEYATSMENDVTDSSDEARKKKVMRILKCVAGKGNANCQLSILCGPKQVFEAKVGYRYAPSFDVTEILAQAYGETPVEALSSACKIVKEKILSSVSTDALSKRSSTPESA